MVDGRARRSTLNHRLSTGDPETDMARVKMTPFTKAALYFLRIYLIVLLVLILVRFLRVFG